MLKIGPRETPLKFKDSTGISYGNFYGTPCTYRGRKAKERNVVGKGRGYARQPRTSLKGLSSGDVSRRPQNGRRRICTSVARPYVCSAFLNKKKKQMNREKSIAGR